MKNKRKIKKTKKLIKLLSVFMDRFNQIEEDYLRQISDLEKTLALHTGIKDIEFFFCDGELAGIGNTSRTMELIHRNELEEGE